MKIKHILPLFLLFFALGCTKQVVKNRALAISIEKFDDDATATGKASFVDQEQQKVFAEFVAKNTVIEVNNVELQNDNEATGRLTIRTFSKSIIPELQTISGKEWQAKVDAAVETKTYNLKLKKADGAWKIIEQTEVVK